MMPFLYFAIADTVIAPVDPGMVFVHEWGVVELDLAFPEALGSRWGYLGGDGMLDPWTEYEVEAPVVWFHGAECTGTLKIEARQGYFTTLYPYPDSLFRVEEERMMSPGNGGQTAVWRGVTVSREMPELEESLPVAGEMGGFAWAVPFWREVDANYVSIPGSSFLDSFIYYECTAGDIPGLDHECSERPMTYGYTGEALLFTPSGEDISASLVQVDEGLEILSRDLAGPEMMAVICGWGGELKSHELQVLWRTWEPAIRTRCLRGGERVLVFPLTPEQTGSVSTLEFKPDDGRDVSYVRLFLGLGSI